MPDIDSSTPCTAVCCCALQVVQGLVDKGSELHSSCSSRPHNMMHSSEGMMTQRMKASVKPLHRDVPYDCALISHFSWLKEELFQFVMMDGLHAIPVSCVQLGFRQLIRCLLAACLQQQLLPMSQCQPFSCHQLGRYNLSHC